MSRPPSKSSKSPWAAAGSCDGNFASSFLLSFLSPPKLKLNSSSPSLSLSASTAPPKSKSSTSSFLFYCPVANFSNPAPKSNSSASAAGCFGSLALIFSVYSLIRSLSSFSAVLFDNSIALFSSSSSSCCAADFFFGLSPLSPRSPLSLDSLLGLLIGYSKLSVLKCELCISTSQSKKN